RARTEHCSSAGMAVPRSRLTRAGRNATRAGSGSGGALSTRPRATEPAAHAPIKRHARTAARLGEQARRPVRPDPGETRLLALLEPEALLGAEGVALAGPANDDRVED